MSASADAFTVALERAFPGLDLDGLAELAGRILTNAATEAELAALRREWDKVTRADIGREALA